MLDVVLVRENYLKLQQTRWHDTGNSFISDYQTRQISLQEVENFHDLVVWNNDLNQWHHYSFDFWWLNHFTDVLLCYHNSHNRKGLLGTFNPPPPTGEGTLNSFILGGSLGGSLICTIRRKNEPLKLKKGASFTYFLNWPVLYIDHRKRK